MRDLRDSFVLGDMFVVVVVVGVVVVVVLVACLQCQSFKMHWP